MKKPANPRLLALGIITTLGLPALHAAPQTWEGDSSALWAAGLNWVGDPADLDVPGTGDVATFNGASANTSIDLGAGVTILDIVFDTAAAASYTIGDAGDTLTFDDAGDIIVNATVTNPQTIAAGSIVLSDGTGSSFHWTNNGTGSLTVTSDVDSGIGTAAAGVQHIDLRGGIGGIAISGEWSESGDATRLQFNTYGGGTITFSGDASPAAGDIHNVVRDDSTFTITGAGPQGGTTVAWGTLNIDTDEQIFLENWNLGQATYGNGDSTIAIGAANTLIWAGGNLVYNADDDTANTGTVSGGTVDLDGTNGAVVVNDNPLVTGSELTLSTNFMGIGADSGSTDGEDFNIYGTGTLTWNSTLDPSNIDLLIFQNAKTIIGPSGTDFTNMSRDLIIRQENNADRSNFDVEFDINGQELVLDDDMQIGLWKNTDVAELKAVRLTDSADSPTSMIRLTSDNDIVYQDGLGGGGTQANKTHYIEADLQFEGSNFTMNIEDGADEVDLEISGTITDGNSGGRNLYKNQAGTLKLTATDNLYNMLQIARGTVQITNAGALGDNDIQLGDNTFEGDLEYVGTGETIGSQFRLGDNNTAIDTRTGQGGILNNGTGDLALTAAPFFEARASAATNRTLTLGGATGNNTITGLIADNNASATIGITKTGTNTWTLSGANTYTGDTDVQAGRLNLNGSVGGNLAVADGASIGGDATFAGTVNLGTTTGTNLHIDGSTGAALTATGAINTSNGVTVFIDKNGPDGITVLSYNNAAVGNNIAVGHFTLDGGVATSARLAGAPAFTDTGSAITIDLGFENTTWVGDVDSNWDIGTTGNWNNSTDSLYHDGDLVTFDDTATSFNPTLQANVATGLVTFSNDTEAYTVDSAAAETLTSDDGIKVLGAADVTINSILAGSGTLTKNGTGILTLAATNTRTGETRIEQGRVLISDNDALGSGIVTIADLGVNPDLRLGAGVTVLSNNIVFTDDGSAKNLSFYQTGDAEVSGDILNNETQDWAAQILLGIDSNLTVSGQVSGVGAIRSRNGTLTLDNPVNSFAGPLRVDNGGTSIVQSIADSGIASHAGAGSWITVGSDNGDGTFSYTGTGASTDRQVQVGAGGGNTADVMHVGSGTIANNGTGALIFTNNAFSRQDTANDGKVGARTLTLAGTNADDNEIVGEIMDNAGAITPDGTSVDNTVSLAKDGAGKWILSGTNSYTGTTTVDDGTLLINDSIGAGDVTVNGGTLGGTGTIGGAVFVEAAGSVAPGASAGTLFITGDLDISAMAGDSGTLDFELDALAESSDTIEVDGTLVIGSGVLGINDVNVTDLGGLEEGTYTLISSNSGITGALDTAVSGSIAPGFNGELQIQDFSIVLVVTVGGSDYDTWGAAQSWTYGGPGTADTEDYDGDGLTNDDERIFGLDPTSAASVSPITTGLPTSGVFTYTRRDDALTGLSYEIWTSPDLVNWTRDDGAGQLEGPVDGDGIEEVTVTLTASPVGGKLFSQVRVP